MALRHIVLVKVAKKEDASICVEELKKMRESLKPHVPILSFIISENIGTYGSADVVLIVDFPDAATLKLYQEHPLHLTVVQNNRSITTEWLSIQIPLSLFE
ncbi:unnamed protein product [Sphagnum troendelagicum]|uniref:Stress-response A/B barrel domain-containing protein n=1 Tax=Sphagnum troendelagicum TaxID=128251 RepID=A0ABP0UCC1_9BRYO